jgi:ATP-binding cassette subfamily B protein/subfamily B ATP-binding cassette protein MsbA
MNKIKYFINSKVKNPAYKVALATINHNRVLIALNFNANVLSAILEGSTFGLIFLALEVIQKQSQINFDDYPVLNNAFISNILNNLGPGKLFIILIIVAVIFQFLKNSLSYLGSITAGYLSTRISVQMTERVFRQIMSLSFPCSSRYKIGDLGGYMAQASRAIGTQVNVLNGLAVSLLTTIAYIAVLLSISVPLSAVTIIICGLLIATQKYFLPKIAKTSVEATTAGVELGKQTTESLQALRLIHTFARQSLAISEVHRLNRILIPIQDKQIQLVNIISPLAQMINMLTVAGILILGFAFLKNSQSVLPSLATFIIALNRISAQFTGISRFINQLAQNSGDFKRLEDILTSDDKEFSRLGGKTFTGLTQAIKFDQVCLQYPNTEKPALENLTLELKKGKVTALVGTSGAGKSSIADLLIALYEPTQGAILVDGIDLREYTLETWRSHLGVVSQDTFVFNNSIADNIRYGKLDATDEKVIQAAQAAQAHNFIEDLPQGYDTLVGERGFRLSGGQRQRLALARAILRQPEILILDEATSALDTQSERLVQEALAMFQQDKTVLVIAHRLSTIVNADKICVLEKGQLVEEGNHSQLLAKAGKYAKYWLLQSQGVEPVTTLVN